MKAIRKVLYKTPISYYGGKQGMLKHILPELPEHDLYTESFVGGAALLFAKKQATVEVINDLNGELINFYWVASVYYHELKVEIDKTLHSRAMHKHASHIYQNPQFFSPAQRAWAVWALSKLSFAAKMDGTFGYDKTKNTVATKVKNAKDHFTLELCNRLSCVTIEQQNALDVIKRYDTCEAFHFIDPPYINSDCGHYKNMFTRANLVELLELLTKVSGKFMLTMYPHEDIDRYVKENGWRVVAVERTISSAKTSRRKQVEWLVMNY